MPEGCGDGIVTVTKTAEPATSVTVVEPCDELQSKLPTGFLSGSVVCCWMAYVFYNVMASSLQGRHNRCELSRMLILFCYEGCDVLWSSEQINNPAWSYRRVRSCRSTSVMASGFLICQGNWNRHAFSHRSVNSGLIQLGMVTIVFRNDGRHGLWHMFPLLPACVPCSSSVTGYVPPCMPASSGTATTFACCCCLPWQLLPKYAGRAAQGFPCPRGLCCTQFALQPSLWLKELLFQHDRLVLLPLLLCWHVSDRRASYLLSIAFCGSSAPFCCEKIPKSISLHLPARKHLALTLCWLFINVQSQYWVVPLHGSGSCVPPCRSVAALVCAFLWNAFRIPLSWHLRLNLCRVELHQGLWVRDATAEGKAGSSGSRCLAPRRVGASSLTFRRDNGCAVPCQELGAWDLSSLCPPTFCMWTFVLPPT